MTEAERERLRQLAREMTRRVRAEQGLPPHVTDPDVIAQVALVTVQVLRAERDQRPGRVEPALPSQRGDGDVVEQER